MRKQQQTVYYLLLCVSHINVVPLEGRTDTVMEGQLLQLNISLPGLNTQMMITKHLNAVSLLHQPLSQS